MGQEHTQHGHAGQRGDSRPGWDEAGWSSMERDSTRFPHATQNSVQFRTYELLISGVLHLVISDCS